MTTPNPTTDPLRRVLRGGSWYGSYVTTATDVRAAYRYGTKPTFRGSCFGFRTAQTGCRQQVLKVQP